jgi:citrate lyase subunit beta/citryl-CoA lyase
MRAFLMTDTTDSAAIAAAATARAAIVVLNSAGRGDASSLRAASKRLTASSVQVFVRISPIEQATSTADLHAAMSIAPMGVMLAGAASGRDIAILDGRIAVSEAELGLAHGRTLIIAVTGVTAASLFVMGSFAIRSRRLAGLSYDPEALAADLGASDAHGPQALARDMTLLAARAADVPAIDPATPLGGDVAGDALRARRQGFGAKLALSADQAAIIAAIE